MFLNRLTLAVITLVAVTTALVITPVVKGHSSTGNAIPSKFYHPLAPGKLTILINTATGTCAKQDSGAYLVSQGLHPATYLPLPAGKQMAFVDAARHACMRTHFGN